MNAIDKGLSHIDNTTDIITGALSSEITNMFNVIIEQTAKAYAVEELEKVLEGADSITSNAILPIVIMLENRIKELRAEL